MQYAKLATGPVGPGGSRIGTAIIERPDIFSILGTPTHDWRAEPMDEKVTLCWVFQTPRGPAEVRDYWWNASNEWSIAAQRPSAARFLAKHLRSLGIAASTRFYRATDCKRFA